MTVGVCQEVFRRELVRVVVQGPMARRIILVGPAVRGDIEWAPAMRRSWELVIDLDRDAAIPPFLQIARSLAADIQRGRLRPGDRLPGSRRLAAGLHVHRNTVLAALAELTAEGWLETAPGKGTFVTRTILAA